MSPPPLQRGGVTNSHREQVHRCCRSAAGLLGVWQQRRNNHYGGYHHDDHSNYDAGANNNRRCTDEYCTFLNHFSSDDDRYPNHYSHGVAYNDCAHRHDSCGDYHNCCISALWA